MKRVAALLGLALLLGCQGSLGDDKGEEPKGGSRETERVSRKDVVVIPSEAVGANDIRTVEVRSGSSWITARVPGRVEFNGNATAVVHAPLEGRLQEWRINVGDLVKQGDELARVESPQNLGNPVVLRAPRSGEVIERNGALGDWVQPADKLVLITNLSSMWVAAEVREDMVGKIRTEAPPSIRVLSFAGESFTGKLLRIGASVARETRTVQFLFEVANPQRKLRAGMFAYVFLATDRIEDRLLVPDEAIQTIDGRSVVFVEEAPGTYRLTEVRLGRKAGELHELVGGVANGARIVTNGSFVLKSEATRSEFAEEID